MNELDAEYWRRRCELAERCLEVSPCDPDITKEQIVAHKAYDEFLSSPDSTALYTGFTELLERLGMHYSLSFEDGYYHLKIAKKREDLGIGYELMDLSIYDVIKNSMALLPES